MDADERSGRDSGPAVGAECCCTSRSSASEKPGWVSSFESLSSAPRRWSRSGDSVCVSSAGSSASMTRSAVGVDAEAKRWHRQAGDRLVGP
jgi:hypothetical protein